MTRSLLEELMCQHPELDEREARSRIMRGDVLIGTTPATKAGMVVARGAPLVLRPVRRFASRGGEKLDFALRRLGLDVRGKTFVDAGASTGGFTDCLLGRGAALVYAVDVGRSLLAWPLRGDRRVVVLEGTNIMDLDASAFPRVPQACVCDLSFRSLRGAGRHLVDLSAERWALALVKPQYEWRNPAAGFRGVVRDAAALRGILSGLVAGLGEEGVAVDAVCPSGLPGRRGNREFFFRLRSRGEETAAVSEEALEAAVREGLP